MQARPIAPPRPELTPHGELALLARMLHREGYDEHWPVTSRTSSRMARSSQPTWAHVGRAACVGRDADRSRRPRARPFALGDDQGGSRPHPTLSTTRPPRWRRVILRSSPSSVHRRPARNREPGHHRRRPDPSEMISAFATEALGRLNLREDPDPLPEPQDCVFRELHQLDPDDPRAPGSCRRACEWLDVLTGAAVDVIPHRRWSRCRSIGDHTSTRLRLPRRIDGCATRDRARHAMSVTSSRCASTQRCSSAA
jgi:hypothetical protein